MESQPQNPEFRINPENFPPFTYTISTSSFRSGGQYVGGA